MHESLLAPAPEPEPAGVMGSRMGAGGAARPTWTSQFDALVTKNMRQLQSRAASLLVIIAAPAGGGLLVELLRGQVAKYNPALGGAAGDEAAKRVGGLIVSVGLTLMTLVYFQWLCGEKERGLTGAMRMAGLSEGAYWSSYLVLYLATCTTGGIVFELLGRLTRVPALTDCELGVNAFVVCLFALAMTSLASFWSSFAKRPVVVNLLSFFLFSVVGVSALLYGLEVSLLDAFYSPTSSLWSGYVLVPLMPWLSFLRIWLMISETAAPTAAPGFGDTFNWTSLSDPGPVYQDAAGAEWTAPSAGFSLGLICAVVPVYFALAWYTSQAFGGEMRQSIIFPFLPAYWGCATVRQSAAVGDTVAKEQILSRRERSVRCVKISKAYDQVTALKELSMKMEPNAITCLLGHNGAGKTTLINTLTGLVNATFGEAFVLGMSVRDEMADIQKVMGICPQHDKLWEELTAAQHLSFYARFKGMARADVDGYVAAALAQFGLENEADEPVGTFSGGMKRRVSVAISAMADPTVVYLDEPTTGMDPLHRRQVWDMIQQLRDERIMVLTTHSMEEADALGDQIAIMANGKLRALGSSIFLKSKFGRGYQIGLISAPEDATEVERLVDEQLPGAEIVSASAGNLAISLGTRLLSRVPAFFRGMQDGELAQYVKEWSLSNTRLEEVFLRLCAENTDVNAGGTGDSGTLTFEDLGSLTASEAIDVFNELPWSSSQVKHYVEDESSRDYEMVELAVPQFSSDDGTRVMAHVDDGTVALGNIVVDERTKIARDKTVGTVGKPLIAQAVNDGKGTLSVILPATGLPAAKLCVQVPDGRKIFIEVPMDGTIGEEIYFTAPPPIAVSSRHGGIQMEGDELYLTEREKPQIGMGKQTYALIAKQVNLQTRQRKSNCCQCCLYFTLVLFGLYSSPAVAPETTAAVFTPVPANNASIGVPVISPQSDQAWAPDNQDHTQRRLQVDPPEQVLMSSIAPTMFMFCMATMIHLPKFVHVLIEEKQQRLYHSMRLQGMSLTAYWLAVYIHNFVLYGTFAALFIGLGYSFRVDRFMHANAFRYVGATVVYGHSQTGLAMFASSIVRSPKLATVLFYVIVISSCIAAIVINIFIPVEWSPFLLMVPTLAYPRSIGLILAYGGGITMEPDSELARALWIQTLVGTALCVVGFLLHIVIPNEFGMTESHIVTQMCSRFSKTDGATRVTGEATDGPRGSGAANRSDSDGFTVGDDDGANVDPAVIEEEVKVRSGDASPADYPIIVDDLGLVYMPALGRQFIGWLRRVFCRHGRRSLKQAVGGVTLSIARGELFGLLGPNGAGKTSVVNVLSGLIVQSSGKASVGGFDTMAEMRNVHTVLGVCPQFDTVWGELTVEEHLQLYARLKGVVGSDERGLVQSVAEAIQLDGDPLRQPASQLSGGMLRRLSLGIALIADPQVVLLDEPTTGLDPETRRMVWDIIERERGKGRSIILTTHSMEEADTLCTRIGIMAHGKLVSLGTSTELKRRHGQGFRLSFTLKREDMDIDEELLRAELCPAAELVYSFGKSRVYLLPTESTDIAVLFDKLVNMKDELGVREWGLSQATLEEAFIRIATEAGTR